jgi:T-lymphocyte triggering factor
MPPKGPVKAPPPPPDPAATLDSLKQVLQLLAKAKQLRCYFQLERDKVQKLYDVARDDLERLKSELAVGEHELEDTEARHQVELKVYKQKVRHLLFEHKLQVQDLRALSDRQLADAALQHQRSVAALVRDKATMRADATTGASAHDEAVRLAREDHRYMRDHTKRQNYEQQLRDATTRYEQKLTLLRDELDLRRRVEVHEVEEKKSEHLNALIRQHEEQYAELKDYYNQITTNNLELIRSLKEEIGSMKRNDEHNEALMYDIERENQNLAEPLEHARKEVAELQQQLQSYEKDKLSLLNARSRVRAVSTELATLGADHAALKQKYEAVQADRDGLVRRFEAALREAADVAQDGNTELQQRLLEAQARVEERDAQMHHVLQQAGLEPGVLEHFGLGADAALDAKARAIKDLHFELRKLEAQHGRVIGEYERRCRGAGVPALDLLAIDRIEE